MTCWLESRWEIPDRRHAGKVFQQKLNGAGEVVVGAAAQEVEALAAGGGAEMRLKLLGQVVQVQEDDAFRRRSHGVIRVPVDLALAAIRQQQLRRLAVEVGDFQVAFLRDDPGALEPLQVRQCLGVAGEDDPAVHATVLRGEQRPDGRDAVTGIKRRDAQAVKIGLHRGRQRHEGEVALQARLRMVQQQAEFAQHHPVDHRGGEHADPPVVLEQRDEVAVVVVDVAEENPMHLIPRNPARPQVGVEIWDGIHEQVIAVVAQGKARGGLRRAEPRRAPQHLDAELHERGGGQVRVHRIRRGLLLVGGEIDQPGVPAHRDFKAVVLHAPDVAPAQIDWRFLQHLRRHHRVQRDDLALLVLELEQAGFPGQGFRLCDRHAPFRELLRIRTEQGELQQIVRGLHPPPAAQQAQRFAGSQFAAHKQVVIQRKFHGHL